MRWTSTNAMGLTAAMANAKMVSESTPASVSEGGRATIVAARLTSAPQTHASTEGPVSMSLTATSVAVPWALQVIRNDDDDGDDDDDDGEINTFLLGSVESTFMVLCSWTGSIDSIFMICISVLVGCFSTATAGVVVPEEVNSHSSVSVCIKLKFELKE